MGKIELNNGEYTVINELGNGGGFRALRYGEEWRNLAGDNLVLALYDKIEDLQNASEETVTISKAEYENLLRDSELLSCLEACGVDNWCGWDDAMEMFNEEDE